MWLGRKIAETLYGNPSNTLYNSFTLLSSFEKLASSFWPSNVTYTVVHLVGHGKILEMSSNYCNIYHDQWYINFYLYVYTNMCVYIDVCIYAYSKINKGTQYNNKTTNLSQNINLQDYKTRTRIDTIPGER